MIKREERMQLIQNLGEFTVLEVNLDIPAVRDVVKLSIFLEV